MLEHPAFGGPEGEVDGDRAGLDGVQVQADGGPAAGSDRDRPILLRTGAAQLASAQLAVEARQADGFPAGVGHGDFERMIGGNGDGAELDRAVHAQHRSGRSVVPPQPAGRGKENDGEREKEPRQEQLDALAHVQPPKMSERMGVVYCSGFIAHNSMETDLWPGLKLNRLRGELTSWHSRQRAIRFRLNNANDATSYITECCSRKPSRIAAGGSCWNC